MKKKLLFGITSLKLGGAERVLVDIVNNICDKYDITIFTLYNSGEFEKEIDKRVKLKSMYNKTYNELSLIEKKTLSLRLVNKKFRDKIYKKYIGDNYDVEIAFLEGPITWILSSDSKARKIAWVHNDIKDVFGKGKKATDKLKLSGDCYKAYQSIVFVSMDNLNSFKDQYKELDKNLLVIYNYLNTDLVIEKANKEIVKDMKDDLISFVQVSRIVEQKALFRLLDVHEKLIKDNILHRMYIVGDGPLMEELIDKVNEKNLSDTFVVLGKRTNPYPYIKKADYFMLMSFYEGYPMVLLEGKALNKYIVITDSAARETLIDYKDNSMIVDNSEDGIYKGIKTIVKNKPKVNSKNKFDNKKVLKEIIDLIEGE